VKYALALLAVVLLTGCTTASFKTMKGADGSSSRTASVTSIRDDAMQKVAGFLGDVGGAFGSTAGIGIITALGGGGLVGWLGKRSRVHGEQNYDEGRAVAKADAEAQLRTILLALAHPVGGAGAVASGTSQTRGIMPGATT